MSRNSCSIAIKEIEERWEGETESNQYIVLSKPSSAHEFGASDQK